MAGKVFRQINRVIDWISYVFLVISGVLTLIMVFTATYGVVRRYIFNSPEPYSYEISIIFLLFTFIFAISSVERLNEHIRVDFFSNRLPERIQHIILNILAPLIGLVFVYVLVRGGLNIALFSLQIGEISTSALAEPLFLIKLMIPICYTLLALVLIIKLCKGFTTLFLRKSKQES